MLRVVILAKDLAPSRSVHVESNVTIRESTVAQFASRGQCILSPVFGSALSGCAKEILFSNAISSLRSDIRTETLSAPTRPSTSLIDRSPLATSQTPVEKLGVWFGFWSGHLRNARREAECLVSYVLAMLC